MNLKNNANNVETDGAKHLNPKRNHITTQSKTGSSGFSICGVVVKHSSDATIHATIENKEISPEKTKRFQMRKKCDFFGQGEKQYSENKLETTFQNVD